MCGDQQGWLLRGRKVSLSGLAGENWFVSDWSEACSRHGSVVICEVGKPETFPDRSLVPLSPTNLITRATQVPYLGPTLVGQNQEN